MVGESADEVTGAPLHSVMPAQEDIDEMNRNILMHPEFYTDRCGTDSMALRRFWLCQGCMDEGLLTLAVHGADGKQWPGNKSAHRHCFCFRCTRPWGSGSGGTCALKVQCSDPGIQQVMSKLGADGSHFLEIGFIDAEAYITWVQGRGDCWRDKAKEPGHGGPEEAAEGDSGGDILK